MSVPAPIIRVPGIDDVAFVDSHLTLDGRNDNANHTMTLTGGTAWAFTETLTLTSSLTFFTAADVGNEIHIVTPDGGVLRFVIEGFTGGTVVTGKPHQTVPVGLRGIAQSDWGRAVDQVGGLWHLEGEDVSVYGDGFVVANPLNSAYTTLTVTEGIVTLDRAFVQLAVGLPVTADLETLDLDSASGESILDKKKLVSKVSLHVQASRGLWVGGEPPEDDDADPLKDLIELKIRNDEGYDDPVLLRTGVVEVIIKGEWNSNGRVFVRQVDPLPLTVLAIAPAGLIPFRG